MTPSWGEAANIATAIGLAVAAIGLLIASMQMRVAQKVARAQFLHELEKDAQRFQSVYGHLLPIGNSPPEKDVKDGTAGLERDMLVLFSALAFFEKVHLLIQNESVDLPAIDSLFGGRFFMLVHSPLTQALILRRPEYTPYFEALRDLYSQWYHYRREHALPMFQSENRIDSFLRTAPGSRRVKRVLSRE